MVTEVVSEKPSLQLSAFGKCELMIIRISFNRWFSTQETFRNSRLRTCSICSAVVKHIAVVHFTVDLYDVFPTFLSRKVGLVVHSTTLLFRFLNDCAEQFSVLCSPGGCFRVVNMTSIFTDRIR